MTAMIVVEVRLSGKDYYETLRFSCGAIMIANFLREHEKLDRDISHMEESFINSKGLQKLWFSFSLKRLFQKNFSKRKVLKKTVVRFLKSAIEKHVEVSIHDLRTSEFRYLYIHEVPKIMELLKARGYVDFWVYEVPKRDILPNESQRDYSHHMLRLAFDPLLVHELSPLSELVA